MIRKLLLLPLSLVLAALLTGQAAAHTVVPPSRPVRPGTPPEIRLQALTVHAEVAEGVARVKIDQTFRNQAAVPAEGTYLFPLPAGALVSGFQMFVDGKPYTGEVLDAGRAREIYEGIVRQNRDPALLQYVGQGLLQARIFPVPPGAERRIRIEYSQVLPRENGLSELAIPIGAEAVPHAAITVDLKDATGATVYSPTHDVAVTRAAGGKAQVSYEGSGARGDFRLFFGETSHQALSVNLLTFKASGEDGYFVLLANPPAGQQPEVIAKDVILVLDLSGSMAGEKFEQAKGAALQVLGAIGGDDRFGIIGFHSTTTAYAGSLRSASEAGQAMEWVRDLRLGGATNIAEAMAAAQRLAGQSSGRPQVILLITDGQPTAGETDPDRIVQAVQGRVTPSQRIFTFGVGYDVNTRLLDAVAQENRGRSEYVKPGGNLEVAVADLWRRVGQPVLSDLTVTWSGMHIEDVYPRQAPDLYLGSQMVLMGRYRKGGTGSVTVAGRVNGQPRSYRFDNLRFAERDTARDYIPRLWANRKVGYLLSEIRLRGQNKELLDEVVALAQRFAIVTPYTSFFVNEPGQPMPPAGSTPAPRPSATSPGAKVSAPAASAPAAQIASAMKAEAPSGQAAVEASTAVSNLREAKSLSQAQASGAAGSQIRTVGSKSFVLKGGIWTDTAYQGGELTHLKLGSEKYLDLIRQRPDLARLLSAGSPLILVDGSTIYAIDIDGAAETAEPIRSGESGQAGTTIESKAARSLWVGVGGALILAGGVLAVSRRRPR